MNTMCAKVVTFINIECIFSFFPLLFNTEGHNHTYWLLVCIHTLPLMLEYFFSSIYYHFKKCNWIFHKTIQNRDVCTSIPNEKFSKPLQELNFGKTYFRMQTWEPGALYSSLSNTVYRVYIMMSFLVRREQLRCRKEKAS